MKIKFLPKFNVLFYLPVFVLGCGFTPLTSLTKPVLEQVNHSAGLHDQNQIYALNPISTTQNLYHDISKTFNDARADIRAGNGGDVVLTNFIRLLYLDFLNPLAKANPGLNILPEPVNIEAFFTANGFKANISDHINNVDGCVPYFPGEDNDITPIYQTTRDVIKILNIFLLPLDSQPAFQQLTAIGPNGAWDPNGGFFSQFINYILTAQLNNMHYWSWYYHRIPAQIPQTSLNVNIGMFDFDAGYQHSIKADNDNPGIFYSMYYYGLDSNQTTVSSLSNQINNFMFLLTCYVNFAGNFLNYFSNNDDYSSLMKWTILNNIRLNSFQTPTLADLTTKIDQYPPAIYNDSANVTLFTAFPRFMINASYGTGPSTNQPTYTWWNNSNDSYQLLLHYNGLNSSIIVDGVQNNYHYHSANVAHDGIHLYNDTQSTNNDLNQKTVLGQLCFYNAWDAEITYLLTNYPSTWQALNFSSWYHNSGIPKIAILQDLLTTSNDQIMVAGHELYTDASPFKRLNTVFFNRLNQEMIIGNNLLFMVKTTFNDNNYQFKADFFGTPTLYNYINIDQTPADQSLNSAILNPLWVQAKQFSTEQTAILNLYNLDLSTKYNAIDLHYQVHKDGRPLTYQLPNLLTVDPKNFNQPTKLALYQFFIIQTPTSYYAHFANEQRTVQSEMNSATDATVNEIILPWWLLALISLSSVTILIAMVLMLKKIYRTTYKKHKKLALVSNDKK